MSTTKKRFSIIFKLTFSVALASSGLKSVHTLDITWQTSFHHVPQVIHIVRSQGVCPYTGEVPAS